MICLGNWNGELNGFIPFKLTFLLTDFHNNFVDCCFIFFYFSLTGFVWIAKRKNTLFFDARDTWFGIRKKERIHYVL